MTQNTKKTNKRDIVIVAAATVIVVTIIVIVMFIIKNSSSKKVESKVHQYYGGAENVIDAGSVLSITEEGDVLVEQNGIKTELSDTPLYYDQTKKLTITEDMIYYTPRAIDYKRVDHFTDLYLNDYGEVRAFVDNKEIPLFRGFLYNGKNKYVFMEDVVLTYDGYDEELPALSYIEINKSGSAGVFNFEKKEFFQIQKGGDINVSATEDYTVYLLSGTLETSDGVKHLLYSRPDLLDPISKEEK